MILDTSAIIAILLEEPEIDRLLERVEQASLVAVGTPTLVEAGLVLGRRLDTDPRALLARLVQEFSIRVLPFAEHHWLEAVGAYRRFGKGRHPAALNFGDCLSYAVAKAARQPLLCTGDDFRQTDLEIA
ncbi:MAG TPA: type II toxin-antitoxin system VapC family toxin [Thermoanaerobaculia bacterium]|nr:type II toxin-antitoxin system VapC family toxin [Thermoanaerobaculia bacterium]